MTEAHNEASPVGSDPDQSGVSLRIPATAESLILPRLVAAALAARAELGVDEIDDLRLAVDELCLSVMPDEGLGTLTLDFDMEPGSVQITCTYVGGPLVPPNEGDRTMPELSARILEALVDEHSYEAEPGVHRAWLRKTVTPVVPANSVRSDDLPPVV